VDAAREDRSVTSGLAVIEARGLAGAELRAGAEPEGRVVAPDGGRPAGFTGRYAVGLPPRTAPAGAVFAAAHGAVLDYAGHRRVLAGPPAAATEPAGSTLRPAEAADRPVPQRFLTAASGYGGGEPPGGSGDRSAAGPVTLELALGNDRALAWYPSIGCRALAVGDSSAVAVGGPPARDAGLG
jgi:hypothetical protein